MQSLLAAGSAIGQRMLGMITRAPRLLAGPPPVAPLGPAPAFQPSAPATQGEHPQTAPHHHLPHFADCHCTFGKFLFNNNHLLSFSILNQKMIFSGRTD